MSEGEPRAAHVEDHAASRIDHADAGSLEEAERAEPLRVVRRAGETQYGRAKPNAARAERAGRCRSRCGLDRPRRARSKTESQWSEHDGRNVLAASESVSQARHANPSAIP